VVGIWIDRGLGSLAEQKLAIVGATLITVGTEVFFTAFLLSILGLRRPSSVRALLAAAAAGLILIAAVIIGFSLRSHPVIAGTSGLSRFAPPCSWRRKQPKKCQALFARPARCRSDEAPRSPSWKAGPGTCTRRSPIRGERWQRATCTGEDWRRG